MLVLLLFLELPAPDAEETPGQAFRRAVFQRASCQVAEARVGDRDVPTIPVAPEQKELLAVVAHFV